MIEFPIRDEKKNIIAYRCRRCGEITISVYDGYCKKCLIEKDKEKNIKNFKINIFGYSIIIKREV
jgi:ribosomal protein L37E